MVNKKCPIPGCGTNVWKKELKLSMFRAVTNDMYREWQNILSQLGVSNFPKTHAICELHFEPHLIERTRTVFLGGGKILEVPRKIPILSPVAVPTIFPTQPEECTREADSRELSAQRGIYVQKNVEPSEQQNISACHHERVVKFDDLFSRLLYKTDEQIPIFPFMENWWVSNNMDGKQIVISSWDADNLSVDRRLVLSRDLKLRFFLAEKEIFINGIDVLENENDLENALRKFINIFPCETADDILRSKNCTGVVTLNSGRQRARCLPFAKQRINMKKSNARKKKRVPHRTRALKMKYTNLRRRTTRMTRKIHRLRLLLRIKSPKAYEHLRSRKILILPHVSTLNRYLECIKGCYGFQNNVFEIIKMKTATMDSSEVHGTLTVDEVKLTSTLSFNEKNLKVEGFTDLGNYAPAHQAKQRGDHALVFLFQPFKGKWMQSLACFLSKGSATGTVLHHLITECIILAEQAGLRVDVVTCDGASWNRNMWIIFGVTKEKVSVPHIVDPERRLWFISDFPHLIKCLRNFITKHGIRDGIWTPDGMLMLLHWYALLKVENPATYNLKVNYKLKEEHLKPPFYKKMNVALAFQFFGVADGMELLKHLHTDLTNSESTIQFCRRVKALITAMNSRTPVNTLKPDNEHWKAIQSFLCYLNNWEKEAEARGFDFMSASTCYGLQVSLQATLELCEYLVKQCGFTYLMTARLNQDFLE